jgi:hypothetical protein
MGSLSIGRCGVVCVQTAVVVSVLVFAVGFAQESTSATKADELVREMSGRQLSAIALQAPDQPDRFIAAMVFPGVQILLVAGEVTSADYLKYQLTQKQFADVYTGLQANAVPDSKIFFHDLGADGLRPAGDAVDILYEHGKQQTMFDGKWKKHGLSASEYQKEFRQADERYARLLSLALDAVRAQAKTPF